MLVEKAGHNKDAVSAAIPQEDKRFFEFPQANAPLALE
jgi:hypothetical protein